MIDQGWCEAMVPFWLLEQLNISYTPARKNSPVGQGHTIYAPVWVYAVWLQSNVQTNWEALGRLLTAVRDDEEERALVVAEAALNGTMPLSVRRAARSYTRILREKREKEADEQRPQKEDS
jgi:hypothetical protein